MVLVIAGYGVAVHQVITLLVLHTKDVTLGKLKSNANGLITVGRGILAVLAQHVILRIAGYHVTIHQALALEFTSEHIAQLRPQPAAKVSVDNDLILV